MSRKLDKTQVLDRIKEAYSIKSNAKLAAFLGIAPTTLSSWYSRCTFDLDLLYEKCVDINLSWLLTGEGSMLREERSDGIIHEDPQVPTPKPDESILYNMYKDLMEEKKEKEKKIEKLTEELRAMERKVGSLEAKLENVATLGNRTADNVSTAKRSSQSRASAHSASAPLNE